MRWTCLFHILKVCPGAEVAVEVTAEVAVEVTSEVAVTVEVTTAEAVEVAAELVLLPVDLNKEERQPKIEIQERKEEPEKIERIRPLF